MKVISYNLLNHKVETGDDHHVHPDGSPVFTDEFNAARLGARLALIARWISPRRPSSTSSLCIRTMP